MAKDRIRMPPDHLAGIPLADGGAPDRTKKCCQTGSSSKFLLTVKVPRSLDFTVIRKYLQQLIINADKQSANKSREYITFISGRFSAFLLYTYYNCLDFIVVLQNV